MLAPPQQAGAPRPRRSWRIAKWLLAAGAAAVAVWAVTGQAGELSGAEGYLEQLRPGWIVVAALAEVASYVAFGAMQQRLLRAGGTRTGLVFSTGVAFAGNAIQNSLPGGVVISAAFAFRQYRRYGADDVLCGWVVVTMTLLSMATLAGLAVGGLAIAANSGSVFDVFDVVAGVVAVVALAAVAWHRRDAVVGHAVRLVRLCQRLTHRPAGEPADLVAGIRRRVGVISPSRAVWAQAGGLAAANWVLDMGCLAAAYAAVDASVPWRGLLLAYAGAQLATNLPITPGGLGVVEGSLTIALVAFGGEETSTVAAVLLYRLCNFWGTLPVGWGAWGLLTLRHRRSERSRVGRLAAPAGVAP